MSSFSGLQIYRKCPRLYGFELLGFSPIEVPEAMQVGSFVHTAIAAHFKGMDWQKAMEQSFEKASARIQALSLDTDKAIKALKSTSTSLKRAKELATRYIGKWTNDYSATLVETWVELGPVRGIVDLIAYYQDQRVIVDYKTSKSPDMRWYDVSGQVDLYAYVLKEQDTDIDLVIYDVISEEGIFRHARPPRLEAGEWLHKQVSLLPDLATSLYSEPDKPPLHGLLANSHLAFDCPNRCQFWLPCYICETGNWDDVIDYLSSNFIKEG